MIRAVLVSLVLLVGLVCAENVNSDRNKDEITALSRDGFSRENPDAIFDGFFAAWPAMLYVISVTFLVLAILGFLGYVTGLCKSPRREFTPVIA